MTLRQPHFYLFLFGCILLVQAVVNGEELRETGPYINTWLVIGTFDNNQKNSGYDRDWIDEEHVKPQEGSQTGGKPWSYFDDRLFSRNYDDYQDLFSYFKIKRKKSIAAKVAYAHVYVHSQIAQEAELSIGADNEFKAWVNGSLIVSSLESTPHRDTVQSLIKLDAGWNRLLLKIANQENGRFGFYARLSKSDGTPIPGLTFSVNQGGADVSISTKPMADAHTGSLPIAFREWPFVGATIFRDGEIEQDIRDCVQKPQLALQASDFVLTAEGGTPPYLWSLVSGRLPKGLGLEQNGTIRGVVAESARLGDYKFKIQVTDQTGESAESALEITVKERPNKWYEESRLTALIHTPECLPDHSYAKFMHTMKRQGYQVGMLISYNNGRGKYRWPSIYHPDNPLGDVVGKYKKALEAEGIKFGMYMGNLHLPANGGENGAILMVEDAMRRYNPTALWFDWAAWNGVSLDSLYSMIKSYNPETVIILNGVPTVGNGDWDIIVLEGWGAWGERMWALWPFNFDWPKRHAVETWRMLADPEFEYSLGVHSDWQEYLRVLISLVGEGHIANIDHSPTIQTGLPPTSRQGQLKKLEDSHAWVCHAKMADWASPPGIPALHESYTKVNPGPIIDAPWGYSTMNVQRDVVYLHLLSNARGKSGLPDGGSLIVGPINRDVKAVHWMNKNVAIDFQQDSDRLTIPLKNVTADPVDTIVKIELSEPLSVMARRGRRTLEPVPPGNLASHKIARLLSNKNENILSPSGFNFARFGVDGDIHSGTCAGGEWPWTFEVDLHEVQPVHQVVVHFAKRGYASEYKILLSSDRKTWQSVAHVTGGKGGVEKHSFAATSTRYVRVKALKPDGPDQEGSQMIIDELEVY